MSLINDALRKASESPASAAPAETKEPLHVATHSPSSRWPMFVVPPLVALIFAAGAFLVMRGWRSGKAVAAKETVEATVNQPAPAQSRHIKPSGSAANELVAAPAPAPASANTSAVEPATFPTLKLQGLIWHPQRPSVVINGKSLFVGEKVDRVEVRQITSDSATVVWKGEERVLTLQ